MISKKKKKKERRKEKEKWIMIARNEFRKVLIDVYGCFYFNPSTLKKSYC